MKKNCTFGNKSNLTASSVVAAAASTTTSTPITKSEQQKIQERHIGICNCWTELEKRRKALDLFVQRQFEVNNGVPQKIFYECGKTPKCPYICFAVRYEENEKFDVYEQGSHSHLVRSTASSVFLVDELAVTDINLKSRKRVASSSSSERSTLSQETDLPRTGQPRTAQRKSMPSTSLSLQKHASDVRRGVEKSPPTKRKKITKRKRSMSRTSRFRSSSTDSDQSKSLFGSKKNIFSARRKIPNRAAKTAQARPDVIDLTSTSPASNLRSRDKVLAKQQLEILSHIDNCITIVDKNNKGILKKSQKSPVQRSPSRSSLNKSTPLSQNKSPAKSARMENEYVLKTTSKNNKGSVSSSSWQLQRAIKCDDAGLQKFRIENYPEMKVNSKSYWICKKADDPDVQCKFSILVQTTGNTIGDQQSIKQIYTRDSHNHQIPIFSKKTATTSNGTLNTNVSANNEKITTTSNGTTNTNANVNNDKTSNQINKDNKYFNTVPTKDTHDQNKQQKLVQELKQSNGAINPLPVVQKIIPNASNHSKNIMENVPNNPNCSSPTTTADSSDSQQQQYQIGIQRVKATTAEPPSPTALPYYYQKEWYFNIEQAWPSLQQIANELLLAINKEGVSIKIFSNDAGSDSGHYLLFTDSIIPTVDLNIRMSGFVDDELVEQGHWPKASVDQFLCAVRGKCMEFFFKSPLDSSMTSAEENINNNMNAVSPKQLTSDHDYTNNTTIPISATPEYRPPSSINRQTATPSTIDSQLTIPAGSSSAPPKLIKQELDKI